MPITKGTAYIDSSGVAHQHIEHAQRAELKLLFWPSGQDNGLYNDTCKGEMTVEAFEQAIANLILADAEGVLAILTTGPTSRPSTRKRAGTTSPRRAAKRALTATEAQAQASTKLGQALSGLLDTTSSPASGEHAQAGFKAMRETTEAAAATEAA